MTALDDPLVLAFERATIEPTTFGHREHLYLAAHYERDELEAPNARLRFVLPRRRASGGAT